MSIRLTLIAFLVVASHLRAADSESLRIVGPEVAKLDFSRDDGGLQRATGSQTFVVFRAEAGGWTYHHHPDIACWRGRLYVGWNSCERDEDTWPSRELYSTSTDGERWSPPAELFPQGVSTPLRIYFFCAPNGRMLAIAGLRLNHEPLVERNKGAMVVREIRADHSFGPVYTLRPPTKPIPDQPPAVDSSSDPGFVEACRQLLANGMFLQQQDYGLLLDPAERMKWNDPANWPDDPRLRHDAEEFGKAMCFFQRDGGEWVGLSKSRWVTVSRDDGKTWTQPDRPSTLITGGGKVWGQRTPTGKYILVYNPHPALRHPLAIVTSDDGVTFSHMRALHGELPPLRFPGKYKDPGASYTRGISLWSSDGSRKEDDAIWLVFSVNKEEIWVCRLTGL